MKRRYLFPAAALLTACHFVSPPPKSASPEPYFSYPLTPGTGNGSFDFIGYDAAHRRVWMPYTRGAGFVDVYDFNSFKMNHLTGFGVKELEDDGKKRVLGPSSVAIGNGVAWIGNRGTHEICPVDLDTFAKKPCATLPASPDCILYVASTKELWVTTPKTSSIVVLDADTLANKATITVDGQPEGVAVDEAHGFFYTNLEDKSRTLRIGLASHKVESTWDPGCSDDGPRCLQVDSARGFLMVACTDHVQVLDANHDGAKLGKLDTGAGVDDISYVQNRLYVAAGKAQRLTVAELDAQGNPKVLSTTATLPRVRNAIADASGTAYVIDPVAHSLLVFPKR